MLKVLDFILGKGIFSLPMFMYYFGLMILIPSLNGGNASPIFIIACVLTVSSFLYSGIKYGWFTNKVKPKS